MMPRSFLINDKPKVPKSERHRPYQSTAAMEYMNNNPVTTSSPVIISPQNFHPHSTSGHVSVDSLPYSIAKLTSTDDGTKHTTPQSNPTDSPIVFSHSTMYHLSQGKTTEDNSPKPQFSTQSSMLTSPPNLQMLVQPAAVNHRNTSPSLYRMSSAFTPAALRITPSSKPSPRDNVNIPGDKLHEVGSNKNQSMTLSQSDYIRHLQHVRQNVGSPHAVVATCQDDNKQMRAFEPNFHPSHLKSSRNMLSLDHKSPGCDPMLQSDFVLPSLNNIKSLAPNETVNPVERVAAAGHVPMFGPYVSTQPSLPPYPTSVFQTSPPRDNIPTPTTTPPLVCGQIQEVSAKENCSPPPIEVQRSSTPGDKVVNGVADISVVSTELDRSSDSGLDSGHRSSDFEGEAEIEEEQIDVVGDGDHDMGDEGASVLHGTESHEDLDEKEKQTATPPLPVVRPQPKRSSDMRLEPISPVSSNSSLSPGSAGSFGNDLFKFNDPRFWSSSLSSFSHHYLPNLNTFPRGLALPISESLQSNRTPSEVRPIPGDSTSFPDKQKMQLSHMNNILNSPARMAKHPAFMHLSPSLFGGVFCNGNEMNKQTNPSIPSSLTNNTMHQGFTSNPPEQRMPLPSPNVCHQQTSPNNFPSHKTRATAPTLPWLLDLPGFSMNKDGLDRPPVRKNNEPPRYQCDACKKSYATFSGLSKHKQFHCESHIKKEFSCKYCDKRYTSLGALKMHIRTHTLPCKCQICGKAFSRPWLLQGHIRTHTGEKPFSCQHCNRAFADRSNLRAHLQTHSDIKKYCCKSCTKTFSRMSLLLKHEENSCPGARGSIIAAV